MNKLQFDFAAATEKAFSLVFNWADVVEIDVDTSGWVLVGMESGCWVVAYFDGHSISRAEIFSNSDKADMRRTLLINEHF